MPDKKAVASGNWSSTSTWDGGTLPASGDDVFANNFTVEINQNISVKSLQIGAGTGITAGGGFVATNPSSRVISLTDAIGLVAIGAFGTVLTIAGSGSATVNAGAIGGASSNRRAIQVSGGATVTVNGNIVGGSSGVNTIGVDVVGTGAVVTINGNVTGGAAGLGASLTGTNAILTVNGVVSGGSGAAAVSQTASTSQLTIVGAIAGGSSVATNGLTVTAGAARIDALLLYGVGAPIVNSVPIMFKRTGSALAMQAPSDDNWPAATGTPIIVERYTTGNPPPEDVREGVDYGPGDTSTGTLAVPPASSVSAGVPTDDTVGTAALSLADLAAVTGGQIAAALT